jgi:geranylgeranyl diphosphate synthase type II
MMAPSASFRTYVEERRAEIDRALALAVPEAGGRLGPIYEAMRYSLFAGGKRFRPILVLAAADAIAGGPSARALAMPAACAIEMIHTYSLIHDDLPAMDDDTLRRGKPTLHVVHGEGTAILAGDGLQAEAFALMARSPDSAGKPDLRARKLAALQRVAEAVGAAGMVGGQAIDLQAAGGLHAAGAMSGDDLRDMHARKTGALIRASAVAGAIMAGGSDAQVAAIDEYAANLGLAFQIVDDILDVEGSDAELGKTAGKDAAADKPTYPALFGLVRSRAMADDARAAARAALARAGLYASHLADIGDWVVTRSS